MSYLWSLACSNCDATRDASGLPSICPECGDPWLVHYSRPPAAAIRKAIQTRPWDMWRYREWLPLAEGEEPVTLGEGMTPLLRVPTVEASLGLAMVWVKDEGQNPCGSFKARGIAAAVTRAVLGGAASFTIPTAGNAGVALAAYGTRARVPVRVYAPRTTPETILAQIRIFGADLHLLEGHIGDCGQASRSFGEESGALDVSTLREPYRIEGKKTLGLELAEQLEWALPDCIIYPTGGGTGLIGMWKAFNELRDAGWISGRIPRLFSVQSAGCAPVIRAFENGAAATEAWPDPETYAAGLRVPAPLGGKLILRALRDSRGGAVAVSDAEIRGAERELATVAGIDACPEGGATLVGLRRFVEQGLITSEDSVVLFNTGAGWLYR